MTMSREDVARIFPEMVNRFNGDKAEGIDAAVQFDLSGDNGGQYWLKIADKQATVGEVVTTGRLSRRRPFVPLRESDRSRVRDALQAVGLTDRTGQPFSELSGGQQQLVLIARALAGQAELLVLDEPFAGVDLKVQASLAALIGELNADGTTVLVVLHETGALEPLLTNSLVLREGRVVYTGTPPRETDQHHEPPHPHRQPLMTGPIGDER